MDTVGWGLLLLTFALIGVVMAAMAVGVLFGRRCLRGSCGGPEVVGPDGRPLTCDTCPNRRDHAELRVDADRRPAKGRLPRHGRPAA